MTSVINAVQEKGLRVFAEAQQTAETARAQEGQTATDAKPTAEAQQATDAQPQTAEQAQSAQEKPTAETERVPFSPDAGSEDSEGSRRKITAETTSAERAEILRGRKLENIKEAREISAEIAKKIPEIVSYEDVNRYFWTEKRDLIRRIAKEFEAFKSYQNSDIDLEFDFSFTNYRESYNKQKNQYSYFAKMLSVLDSIVNNAVGIEVHKRSDYKPDPTLKNMYVLMSAFEDGDSIIPVKLEIKEFYDKQNTLYVAITTNVIKKAEVYKQGTTKTALPNTLTLSVSVYHS